jgi:hypothetical protein
MSKQIEVKILGIKQDALDEINEWARANSNTYSPYTSNNFKYIKPKTYKNIRSLKKSGLEKVIDTLYTWRDFYNKQTFDLKLKHLNIEVYEVEVIKNYTKIEL